MRICITMQYKRNSTHTNEIQRTYRLSLKTDPETPCHMDQNNIHSLSENLSCEMSTVKTVPKNDK